MGMTRHLVDPSPSTLSNWQPEHDHRHGVKHHEGSGANTFVVESRAGCRLRVPAQLLFPNSWTMTLEEYRAWDHQSHGKDWDDFKADVSTGIRNPLFITVDYGQAPKLSEGNHRRDAAAELGHTHVPATVRYFGKAEEQGVVGEKRYR